MDYINNRKSDNKILNIKKLINLKLIKLKKNSMSY